MMLKAIRQAPAAYEFAEIGAAADADMPAALMLDESGIIRDCERGVEGLFGYKRPELVWRHVSLLLPQLAGIPLLKNGEVNHQFCFHCRIGNSFQARAKDGACFGTLLFLNDIGRPGSPKLRLIVRRHD
jgi:PAS domain-containing protein